MVATENNGIWDIFLWEKSNELLKRISLTADRKERHHGYESASRTVVPAISGNGHYMAFATTVDNIVPGQSTNFQHLFCLVSTPECAHHMSSCSKVLFLKTCAFAVMRNIGKALIRIELAEAPMAITLDYGCIAGIASKGIFVW